MPQQAGVLNNKIPHPPAPPRQLSAAKRFSQPFSMQEFPRIRIKMQLSIDAARTQPESDCCSTTVVSCAGSIYKHLVEDGQVQMLVAFDDPAHPDRYLLDSRIVSLSIIHAVRDVNKPPLFGCIFAPTWNACLLYAHVCTSTSEHTEADEGPAAAKTSRAMFRRRASRGEDE